MNNLLPLVSIVIPCRNEEKFIGKCLDSIVAQDYPKDKLEILIGDGMSEDKTKRVIENYMGRYSFIKLFDNPKKIAPVAQNIGIKNAKGKIIIIMDVHTVYKSDYISKCIKYLKEYEVDNVGGIWKIMPSEKTLINKAIALVSSSFFGAGNAYYRTGYSKGLKFVDTVFGGCYKKEVFKKIGLYNENLIRSQDMEFNLRLKKAGGKILLVPEIVTRYYPKSTLKEFFKHNFLDGIWTIYPLKFGLSLKLRHYIPFVFIFSLIVPLTLSVFFKPMIYLFLFIISLYLITSLFFSISIAIRKKDFGLFFTLPLSFACRHFGYGLGSLFGFIKLFF